MNEVEAFSLQPVKESGTSCCIYGIPTHMGQYRSIEALHGARPLTATFGENAVLDSAIEQNLHPHTDAQNRTPARQSPINDLVTTHSPKSRHTGLKRTNTRDEKSVAVQRAAGIGRDVNLCPGPHKRTLR